jgi:hypothetical protein
MFWLAGRLALIDRLHDHFAFRTRKAAPGRETVVSLTRPIYSGKDKLQPYELWSSDQLGV